MLFALSPCAQGLNPLPLGTTPPAIWSSGPARHMKLDPSPLGIDPDGKARWLVRVRFLNADGNTTKLVGNGDIEFYASRGEAQWQTRSRYGGPAAIVSTTIDGPLAVRAVSKDPAGIDDVHADTDTRKWNVPRVVAAPLGPHMVQIGWFPAARTDLVVVTRSSGARSRIVCTLAESSTCRDTSVRPGASYRYIVKRLGGALGAPGGASETTPVSLDVTVPSEAPHQSHDALRGKGMWLRFSPDPSDPDSYTRLDASEIVARAKRAGIRYIELRMSYGEFWELTPDSKARVDALIDAAADARIAVIAWTVPRAPSFEDISLAVSAANYRTEHGTRVAGIAIDLERGTDFMGNGAEARKALADYTHLLRQALGPRYFIVATVEDPVSNRLSNRDFPFSEIARDADALQPMLYWRFFQKDFGDVAVRAAVRKSIVALQREAGRKAPVNIGGQTSSLGPCGGPPPDELIVSLTESRRGGAIGEAFFDWFGTLDPQWDAIASFHW